MRATSLTFLLLMTSCASTSQKVETVEELVLNKKDQYRQCYHESDSYLGKKEHHAPDMSFKFTLSKAGKISDSKLIHSLFKDANLNACIIGVVKSIKFAPQKEDYTFNIDIPLSKKI